MLHLDGDVILRLIGVDAPSEEDPFAKRAAEYVRSRIEGRKVTVEFDRERRDREGRVFAYVYADRTLLNEEMIRSGWARLESNSDIDRSMATRFRHAEEEARGAGRGIWGVAAVSAR
jgi:micrococcal nuclease